MSTADRRAASAARAARASRAAHGRRAWSRQAAMAGAAALLAAAGLGFGAGPAQADASVTLSSPAANATLTTATVHVAGKASESSSGGSLSSITIQVTSNEGHGGGSKSVAPSGNPTSFAWDFATTWNGNYTVTVTAQGQSVVGLATNPSTQKVQVAVEAKPAPPANLTVAANRDRTVTLRWDANSEPDLIGYQIQRTYGSNGDWAPVADTADTTYTDTDTANQGGTYTYQVVAVRSGAPKPNEAPDAIVSDPSSPATTDVAAGPATTTTTAAGGSGSGGGTTGSNAGSSGTGTGTGGASRSGGSAGTSDGPQLATAGKTNLSNFAALLDANRRPTPKAPPTTEDTRPYQERLPFKKGTPNTVGPDGTALGVGVHEVSGTDGHQPIAFVAASLLVTVILMHVLWLKRQVDRAPALAAAVAELPAAPLDVDRDNDGDGEPAAPAA